MKFKIERSRFLEGLRSVQNIVNSKGSLPILQNVLIEAVGKELKLTTTDLDISIKVTLESEVLEAGLSTLPVKLLFNVIDKVIEGKVEVEIDAQDRAVIIAGKAKYKIAGMPEKNYPKLPEDENCYEYNLKQNLIKEMLRKVSYAASQDDTRRTLKGVLMSFNENKLTMVATDGRRLGLIKEEIEFPKSEERDIVLPAKTVAELQRSLNGEGDVTVKVQKSQICFKFGNVMMYSKLIEENYPNYKQVIPQSTREHIEIDRQQLLDALNRVSVMSIDETHSVRLTIENGQLIVSSASTDVGEAKDQLDIKYAGEKIEIMFNPSYVMDPLKVIDDDEITFNINDGHSPSVITCSSKFLYVLMPLRIN